MDHITLPTNTIYDPVAVPCLGPLDYDAPEFESYPARRGWSLTSLLAGNFRQGEQPSSNAAAFLQDWLFFGTLREVLGGEASKSAYTVAHMSCENGRVSTRLLETHVRERVTHCRALQRAHPADFYALIWKFERVLLLLSRFCGLAICENYTDDFNRQTTASNIATTTWPLSPEIDLSIRSLGSYLSTVLYGELWAALDGSVLPRLRFYGSQSTLVLNPLRRANYCPSDVTRAVQQYSPSSLYYLSMLERPEQRRDHSRCTDLKCCAYQLDPSTYRTRHIDGHANCECMYLGPPIDEVVRTIADGKIPLLT